jgi:predicted transcriptional regulator
MQDDDVAFGDVQFLTGSPQRRNVLKALCEEPARPHELCADIDATRTTIQRILAGFRERQWVVKYDGDYRPTVTGRRICQQYEALLGELRLAREFGPLAAHLGPVANDLPIEALERGQLTVSDEGSPLAVLSRFTEWFRAVEGQMHAMTPVVAQPFNEIGVELVESGAAIDIIIDRTVFEKSRRQYESEWDFAVANEGVSIYIHESPVPAGLAFDDERCCLVAYDEDNNLRAMLESTDDELYDWAQATYEQYRSESVPLENPDTDTTAVGGDQ